MNKILKGCLIVFCIFLIFILIITGLIYYQTSTSRERSERDFLECANTQYIIEEPLIEITDSISTKNVKTIKIIVVENSKNIDSVNLKNSSDDKIEFNFPLKKIPLSSSIIIKTDNHKFIIENMKYFNDEKWGMVGYLGKNCQFSYDWKKLK